jgi:phytoene dehydrogenase-like protein
MSTDRKRAVVIGSGPNGLSAAIVLARAGYVVTVLEGAETIGGGARSAELTLPGFVHDVCSAVHPMAVASPCFEEYGLERYGLHWIHSPAPLAHPLDDGTAIMLERSLEATVAGLGAEGGEWQRLVAPLVEAWPRWRHDALAPLSPRMISAASLRFGWRCLFPGLRGLRVRALFAGIAAHAAQALDFPVTRSVGLVLAACAHTGGWPFPRGGSQKIADALATCLRESGGEIVTGSPVTHLPDASIVMCDVTPRQMLSLAGARLPGAFRGLLEDFRYGPGAYKMDWALDRPIPWRAPECARAGTVHLGGTAEEIAAWENGQKGRPFVLLAQSSLFDPSRAPAGKHTAWGYCHVPNGSTADMTDAIEDQVERFAPGFRAGILARSVLPPAALERRNPNLVGGDFNAGALVLDQLLLRPTPLLYATPLAGVYFCGASTPPGGSVHGMCGYNAAKRAIRKPA